jgi:glycosyltransferase involved in cell wall biosynthesis
MPHRATPTLTVIVPVYNEEATLQRVLDAVEERPEVSQIVVVDDGSTDRTPEILASRRFRLPARVIHHPRNRGKGCAVRSGLAVATGELALVQDADLEYDPADYERLLAPFRRGGVTVVYGTRTFGGHSAYSFWYVVGNRMLTLWTNVLFNTYITDMETCYKVMPLRTWRELDLRSDGFSIEPEVTAKLLRGGHRIFEVPISYVARGRGEGKKLTVLDGVRAALLLARIRFGVDGDRNASRGAADGA